MKFFSVSMLYLYSCHYSFYFYSHNVIHIEIFSNYYSVYLGYYILLPRNKRKQTGFEQWLIASKYINNTFLLFLSHMQVQDLYLAFKMHKEVKHTILTNGNELTGFTGWRKV